MFSSSASQQRTEGTKMIKVKSVEAQDIARNMFVTDGSQVFKVVKVIPLHLVGVKEADMDGVRIVPTYTHVQFVTSRGRVLNFKITDEVTEIKVS
jgi:hypothetical protein